MLGMLIGAAVASKVLDTVQTAINESEKRSKTIIYDSQGMLAVNKPSEDFSGIDYMEAIHTLIGIGFTNIKTHEIREYRNNFFNKNMYGRVVSVSINGDSDFKKKDIFPKTAYVLVSFHVFKDSPSVIIPELERLQNPYGGMAPNGYRPQPQGYNPNLGNVPYGYPPNQYAQPGYPTYVPERRAAFCENCGYKFKDGDSFCQFCGAPRSIIQ